MNKTQPRSVFDSQEGRPPVALLGIPASPQNVSSLINPANSLFWALWPKNISDLPEAKLV
ncbi:MAG: hypothetical protein R6V55_11575 [Desulfovermiculus sp.]